MFLFFILNLDVKLGLGPTFVFVSFFSWLIKRTAQQISWLLTTCLLLSLSWLLLAWPCNWLVGDSAFFSAFSVVLYCVDVNRISFSFLLKFYDEGHGNDSGDGDACNVLETTVRRCILAQSFINLVAGQ